ncbi:hypothetical protein BFW88_04965 [Pseudomonas fluorescens]|nr:hypothetical protein BFW88_04965 [Pseudomonas fluorescens]OPB12434.1 hypothetical protein BFW92_04940 [Pseudomonas fluorescens]OPB26181.1 hypothetical protein BFW93_04960 [Pseudomonas fluorescens]
MALWAVVWGLAPMPAANAASLDITAVFAPDSANPHRNEFKNTTGNRAFCGTFPAYCERLGIHSLSVPITFRSNAPILANHESPRQGAMFKVPSNWRTLQVTNTETGETSSLEVRIAGIGSTYILPKLVSEITEGGNHASLWVGGSWGWAAPSPCIYTGWNSYSGRGQNFFWITPEGDYTCAKKARFDIPQAFDYNYAGAGQLLFAYALRTPNPLQMSTGNYVGSLTYSIGPGQDFDMGDVMVANDSALTLNFNLEVQHTLKIEVPPGGNRVELIPQGGWQAWLSQGRKPTRLFRDQTFHLYASSRFKMALECQYGANANTCMLWEPNVGHAVPVNISVSLPHGLTDAEGQTVSRRPLRLDGIGTELFQPGFYVERKPATLHFEIAREHVEEMLGTSSRTYAGNVTVIWDSEV